MGGILTSHTLTDSCGPRTCSCLLWGVPLRVLAFHQIKRACERVSSWRLAATKQEDLFVGGMLPQKSHPCLSNHWNFLCCIKAILFLLHDHKRDVSEVANDAFIGLRGAAPSSWPLPHNSSETDRQDTPARASSASAAAYLLPIKTAPARQCKCIWMVLYSPTIFTIFLMQSERWKRQKNEKISRNYDKLTAAISQNLEGGTHAL
jgi:hypothetical protein